MENTIKNSILIVDDEKSNLLVLNNILSDDYTLYMARDGREAIDRVSEYLPDLILLDIIMPGMDGYEILLELKKSEKTRDIPVIFITGLNKSDDETKGLSLGAADYISKPFNHAIVKLRVQNQIKIINQMRLIIEKELAEKSSRVKSEFLSRMSHEMRTPMNAVIGMINLTLNSDDPQKRKYCLTKASIASHGLMRLIDDMLDITDINDNKLNFVNSEFDFVAMLQNIALEMHLFCDEKQQTLTTEIDPSIPAVIICDKKRLSQVIMNLLMNAVKFTQNHGLIHLKAFALNVEHDCLTMQIEVTDNGIGISKEQQKNLFVAFEQIDGGIDRKYGGAGLGLYISQKIVEMMGGEIWVESEPGKGSKFMFTFKTQIKLPEEKDETEISLTDKTILLVEDIEINRVIVISTLEDTGMNFICAENGREAVELFSADPKKYDIILMDINMPEMDGVEATRRIRALGIPESAQVPIIAVTANTSSDEIKNYIAAGMTDHIGKPIDYNEVLNKIRKYII